VSQFWVYAALLSLAAVAVLIVPLLRQGRRSGQWSALGVVAAIAIVPVSFGIYSHVRTWNPEAAARASEGERLVGELAAKLKASPDDVDGWLLLARSYMVLGRYAEGRDAYAEAWKRTPVPDSELKVAYAESQILSDRAQLGGDAGRLIEEVLAADPGNAKGLWYGGLVALELGREDLVKQRWSALLALDPPEEIANLIRTQLAALGEEPPAGAVAGAGSPAAPSGPTVRLDVSLGAGRSSEQIPPNALLFIFARAPGGGPPVAAIRERASSLPRQFTLSDADAMIPGRSLGDYEELTLVARVSASGQPIEQPGDLFAQATFRPKEGGTVALVIDQVVQ
jgi:cytochrome c-type biogenesis protein CcmH